MSKYAVQVKNVKKKFSYSNYKNNSLKSAITQVFKQKDTSIDSFYALDGVSFNVEKGDFFGILGRNGSGKSTLLKIISEIYQPTNGSVEHDGKVVSFIELGVGFKSELSGRENVYLNGALLGFSKTEIDEMYGDIVAFAELDKFMDQRLKNYSSGMKVRLAFSVAIRAKADILILDEVLAVGDAAFRRKCNDYFKTLKDNNKTVILVTHSMKNVHDYCNKAIVIEEGKIIFEGDADCAAETYNSLFLTEQDTTNSDGIPKRIATEDGDVKIESVKAKVLADKVTIGMDIKAYNSVSDVVIDLSIHHKKRLIATLNDIQKKDYMFSLQGDQKRHIEFDFVNYFSGRTYDVHVRLRSPDEKCIYDWWQEATTFTNLDRPSKPTEYITDIRFD